MLDYDLAEIYGYEVIRLNENGDRRIIICRRSRWRDKGYGV